MNTGKCIALLIRAPIEKKVKTRLSASIGAYHATALYKHFVSDILATLDDSGFPVVIACAPEKDKAFYAAWLGSSRRYTMQRGKDLGERLHNLFQDLFDRDYSSIVIVASDSPDLSLPIFEESFSFLENHDAVIGPATDGGYYLLGFNKGRLLQDVFSGIPWGTGSVFAKTTDVFRKHDLSFHVLPVWDDIDVRDDLKLFYLKHIGSPGNHLKTMKYLNTWKGLLLGETRMIPSGDTST